jgi:hypothetical protein
MSRISSGEFSIRLATFYLYGGPGRVYLRGRSTFPMPCPTTAMPTMKLRLDDLQVTSFATTPGNGPPGTVVGHDGTAPTPPGTFGEVSCAIWQGSCGTCPTGRQTCFDCETQYNTCGASCASCAVSCADPYTCDAMSTCLAFPTCSETCYQTCFRCGTIAVDA